MQKASISSLLVVVLSAAWWLVALGMVLTLGLAAMSAFHEMGNAEVDLPVSFSVGVPVSAPSLGIEQAAIEHARGSVKFRPLPGTSFIAPAFLGVALWFAAVLFVIGQLRAVLRTLRDGQPFVRANAARIRWIAFAVIAGELARTAIVYFTNSHAMTHFSATGLQFNARPDLNLVTIVHGLVILAIAEVFTAGTRLDEEQSLTI